MSRYAAIDIGSNSIRMLAAETTPQASITELASDRQVVRLGTSVFRDGRLDKDSMDLACQVLSRMAEQYQKLNVLAVRAVGTAALRDASNRAQFLERAAAILGAPVEVISGLEEARLIHLGVQARWPHPQERILVVDIGGGSAELILSGQGSVEDAFSKPLGAVRLTEAFLHSDPPDARELARMREYILARLAGPLARFASSKLDRMIATSATAAAAVCAANNVRRSRRDSADRLRATAPQIRALFHDLAGRDLASRGERTGIGPRRAEIIVAGLAVLHEILAQLKLPRLYYSAAGVRDGIVADLVRRKVGMEQARLDPDQRRVVRALGRRYGVAPDHVRRVADLAAMLFEGLRPLHQLPPSLGRLLEAAAYLYNIGHYVNEVRHHRHSMYLVANADLPGFTERERAMIANLCRYHRKSTPNATHESYQALETGDRRAVLLLIPLLRLAVALDQSREQRVTGVEACPRDGAVQVRLKSSGPAGLEQRHVQELSGVFREIYGLPLRVADG